MEQIKLTALRDFAIHHFPRARTVSTALPPDTYQTTLYGFAALVKPNAPTTETLAAHLLQTVMRLLIEWPTEGKLSPFQRQQAEQDAADTAMELCELTGTTLPWLASALSTPSRALEPFSPTPVAPLAPIERPALQPGPNQDTATAARYLGVKPQTMRAWAMNDDGPLRPVKLGTRNGWPTAELLKLGIEGWQPRAKKAPN